MKPNDQIPVEQKADVLGLAVQAAQREAEIKNAAIRQAERNEKMAAWQDPDAMRHRAILHEKASFESLMALKAAGQCAIQPPLPPLDQLPPHMRNQQPSTIRAWMRGHPEWNGKFKEQYKAEEQKRARQQELRRKYPEMFGISDAAQRAIWDPPKEPEKKTGGGFRIKETVKAPPVIETPKPGLVSRIFAGIWRKDGPK